MSTKYKLYKEKVISEMNEKYKYKNIMQVPKLEKIVINRGMGEALNNSKVLDMTFEQLQNISGQKPVITKAKKSISNFKLRQGQSIGCMVTLRGKKMYDFLERLIWLVLPRTRDFRGISLKSIDQEGNLTIGFKEYVPFPELIVEKEKGIFGLEVTIVSGAQSKEEGIELLRLIGFPLKMKD